jgi:hypothetical protein
MGICFTMEIKCTWCDKELPNDYYYYRMYNEILFNFCSQKCYNEAFKDIDNHCGKICKIQPS